ncbi:hypothetical protein GDO81_022643 [Engystomops pustulosus]|uniref:Uncharacterized protein n=1 Tax=Engystomops pustulosus TaxID=76066 RepID=A0AAV6ZLD2_ENGPU|nr:hypothetical protein GDO81_022643 [Engystomops pustulosus]KAG8549115.1 hypothetical protein GDO81_022643 [Engystomops pustulosus]
MAPWKRERIIKLRRRPLLRRNASEQAKFEDVAVYFSKEEWGYLEEEQKMLYQQVMQENYQIFSTLGYSKEKPKLISCLEQGNDPSITGLAGCLKLRDASNYPTDELHRSLFTPDGSAVEGIRLVDTSEDDLNVPSTEDGLANNHRYNFRDRVGVEYSAFFDDEVRELKKKKVAQDGNFTKPMKSGPYSCSECGKKYKDRASLSKHHKLHTGVSCFVCMKCDKCFTQKSLLRRHEKIHSVRRPHPCPNCEKSFSDSSALQKHQRIHSGYKPYKCPECDKTFSISNYLIVHQRIHTGEKPYVCEQCGKCFRQSSALITHKRTHTGVKPYGCVECGKGFTTSSHLITHQRTHTGERPYQCEECGRAFKHSTHLVLHRRKHTGEKPFTCDKCKKKFSQRPLLQRHQDRHH